jgi:hypothetical protein
MGRGKRQSQGRAVIPLTVDAVDPRVPDIVDRAFAAKLRPPQPDPDNSCEGCASEPFPGIRWPIAIGGDESHPWLQRCDTCERYESDFKAATHVSRYLKVPNQRTALFGSMRSYIEWDGL